MSSAAGLVCVSCAWITAVAVPAAFVADSSVSAADRFADGAATPTAAATARCQNVAMVDTDEDFETELPSRDSGENFQGLCQICGPFITASCTLADGFWGLSLLSSFARRSASSLALLMSF